MRGFVYFTTTLFFITSCGGSGSKPLPTVNLTATPTSVVLGNTSTFSWTSTNANSCSASWTIQTSTFGTELLIINNLGNNTYSITCNGDGGISSASVTVEGYRETDGVVVDGYISGAEVCIDEDVNWTCDSNENSTTSDNEGKFTIRYANGNLVSIGGTDLDSQTLLDNLLITHKLTGHSDFKAVTPVTSIAAFMEDASLVNAALGIDASIDVFTFDPVANKGDGGINDYLYEKGNQLTVLAFALQNITNNLNTTTETTQDYFKAITEEIEKEYTETETKVDIETEAFVTKALENVITAKSVTIDETAKANTAKALAGVMPVIEVKSSDDLTTSVIRFAVSTLQTDIQAIANGTATAETVASYTTDVLAYIAEDQNIDADEITPDISAIADSASTSEDTALEINVLLNDSYLTSSPISVTAGNGTNGTTNVASNVVTYEPDADYNGTDTFSYTITQGDKTSSADVTVTIEAVNDAPSIDIALTIQAQENQTAVTTVSVSDVDEDELTLTLGGTDASSFNLSSDNVLSFKEAPDYETKTSYSITLTLTDGIETVTKDLTIAITNINDIAPEFTSDATFSAAENQTAIGTVTATDAEGDDVSFTVSGSELAITSAGVLTFASAPDYETKTSYTATVTASDGTNSTTQDININVTNLNDNSPSFTSDATFSAAENQTAIGTVTATDADGDGITYSISGSELAITSAGVLTFVSAPDYETKATYTAIVTASDGANSATQEITVNVTNLNDNLPEIVTETFEARENQELLGQLIATDEDNDELTFSLGETSSGGVASTLLISSDGFITSTEIVDCDKGMWPVGERLNSQGQYEKKYLIRAFSVSDGKNTTEKDIKFSTSCVNDNPPTFTNGSVNQESIGNWFEDWVFNIIEEYGDTSWGSVNADGNDFYGVTSTSDGYDQLSFSGGDETILISDGGKLSFANNIDYESDKKQYKTTLIVFDGEFYTSQEITVNILNVNDVAPEFTSEATFSAPENQTAIGTVTATDADGDGITYSISGSDITINSSTGVIAFVSAPDYETKTSYSATVTASDGIYSTTQDITVNVTNVNDNSPAFTSSSTFSADENQTAIGTVTATDADGDTITYSISGSDITINSSSGVIAFASAPDYETKTSYTATVTASDGVNSTTEDVSINTTNIDEGIISWDYYISDGTDSSPPILNSTIQFDASMNIDDAIVTLRQDVNIGGHGFKKIQHTETDTNKWVGTFIFPENANPNISYYGTIFYKEGDNSTNFNGLLSAAITGNSKWTEIITSNSALKLGLTDETTSIFKTFNNESFDSVAPAVQGYIDNQGNLVSNPEDALIISGNDGDFTTPINISLTVQYDEDILYAMVNMYLRTEGGLYTEYRDAETTINKNKVTINLSLNSKTPIDGSNDLRLYIYGYDSGLNRTRTRTGYMDLESNSIGDTNVPTLSSIDFSASLKNDGRKLIDYQYVFSAEDNDLIEIGQTLKGPYCNFVYLRSHDYNIDPTLASGTYSGSKLLAKNMPDGIYITQRALNVHDSQYNKLLINRSDLSNYSLDPIKFGESSDYCPDFKEDRYSDIEIPENISTSTAVTTFKDEIKDPYGNFISPEFSLGGLDGQLFNISSEGDITFKTVPDYENSLDSDNNSRYEIDVRVHSTAYPVSENPNLYISEGITIEVTNVKEWPSSAQVDFIDDTYSYGWVDFIPANFYLAKIIAITSDIPYTKVIISGQDADYFNFQNGTKEGTETNDLNFLIYRNNDNYECGRSFSFRITLTDGTNSVYDDAIIPLTCS